MTPTLKLHRFRFRLRTLFAVTTAIAIYLGWQASIVHERKMLIAEGHESGLWGWANFGKVPWWPIRNLMGDYSFDVIYIHAAASPEVEARIQEVFPEAEIREFLPTPAYLLDKNK